MLTRAELLSLSQSLRRERVLSVYVASSTQTPPGGRSWRDDLDRALAEARPTLDDSYGERTGFDWCVTLLREQLGRLARLASEAGTPGWVAFVTRRGVQQAETVPVPIPTTARWCTGACLTPYVRVLKQGRPAVIVLADAHRARVFTSTFGTLWRADTIRVSLPPEPPTSGRAEPWRGNRAGNASVATQASTQRLTAKATTRMVADASRVAVTLASPDGWILVGGAPRVAKRVAQLSEHSATGRVLLVGSLDVHATDAEIMVAAQQGSESLRDAADLRHVSGVISAAGSSAAASVGADSTRLALEQARVAALYVTERYVREHGIDAEHAVRRALAQGAVIDEVAGCVAALLDEQGGIAARLRTPMATVGEPGPAVA